jgi:transposase InsO family protein
MSNIYELRVSTIGSLVKKEIDSKKASQLLACSVKTIRRYQSKYLKQGPSGLKDKRHSNNYKISREQQKELEKLKKKDVWRSSRNVKDKLALPIGERQVQKLLLQAGLSHLNKKRVKPITRFEANFPNEMWQADIMGRIELPHLGRVYLIGDLDDHSRFCPAAKFFTTQRKINVFLVWFAALHRHGIPNSMLHDRGSQYKANTGFGKADYQLYAQRLGIRLIWANKACTKGKIERFWRFVQDDFMNEVWQVTSLRELNQKFQHWLYWYNYQYRSKYFGNHTHAERYHDSERKLTKIELIKHLTIEERRKVSRESTISLYGHIYQVPRGYINCRIWLKILGPKIYFMADNQIFHKTDMKF